MILIAILIVCSVIHDLYAFCLNTFICGHLGLIDTYPDSFVSANIVFASTHV